MFYHNKFGQNLRRIFDWNTFLLLTDLTVRLALIILPLSSRGCAWRNAPLFASALHQLLVSVIHNFLLIFVQILIDQTTVFFSLRPVTSRRPDISELPRASV